MTAPADAIRARRKLTNRLIVAHDAARLAPFLFTDATMVTGEKSLLLVPAGCAWILAWLTPTFSRFEKFADACTKSK